MTAPVLPRAEAVDALRRALDRYEQPVIEADGKLAAEARQAKCACLLDNQKETA